MERSIASRKGAWTREEDDILKSYIETNGEGKWHLVPKITGLNRCRRSCRQRWLNYLKPNIKRGKFMDDEIDLILKLHKLLGNRWALIAGRIPGRTANDIKNYWNTHHKVKKTVNYGANNTSEKENMQREIIKPRPWTFKQVIMNEGNHLQIAECANQKMGNSELLLSLGGGILDNSLAFDDEEQLKNVNGDIAVDFSPYDKMGSTGTGGYDQGSAQINIKSFDDTNCLGFENKLDEFFSDVDIFSFMLVEEQQ